MAKKSKRKPTKKAKTNKTLFDKRTWGYGLVLALIAFFLYANTLNHGYTLDDHSAITDNFVTKKGVESIPTIFSTHYRYGYWRSAGELYRPVSLAMFATEWQIAGDNPFIFHLVNVLLYALSGFLIFLTLSKVLRNFNVLIPFFATLLFIAHPVHVEAVANIKSRDEIMAFLLSIAALNLLWNYWDRNERKWLIFAALCYTGAMFSKENAITFLAIFPLTYFFFHKGFDTKKMAATAVFLIPAGFYLLVRNSVLGTLSSAKKASVLDNILVTADSGAEQLATALLFIGKYIWTLFFPHPLGHDFGYNQIPLTSFGDWRVLLTLVFVIGALYYAFNSLRKSKDVIGYGILFFIINFSIFSNILIVIGTNYGDRLLYAPSLGFTIALTALVLFLFKFDFKDKEKDLVKVMKESLPVVGILTLIFILFSIKTITRNPVWKDSFTLYESDIEVAPNSAKLNYHYGLELCKKADKATTNEDKKKWYELGMKHLFKAVEIMPEYHDAYSRIGLTHYYSKNYEEAIRNYELSIKYKPNNSTVHSNMGTLYFETQNFPKAMDSFQKAVQIDPRFVDGWRNLGSINAQTGNFQEAIRCFTEALKYASEDATLNYYLGSAYLDSGREDLGRPYLNKAYSINPNLPKK